MWIESTLLVAFVGQPRLVIPKQALRLLEMRTYQSHSEAKARRKIEMFNDGEIPIFREVGFETVFFGESLIGTGLPNLKYLLAAPDIESNQACWRAFVEQGSSQVRGHGVTHRHSVSGANLLL